MDLAHARRLFPLLTERGLENLSRIRQHPDAPRWTHEVGDHVLAEDLEAVEAFRRALAAPAPAPRPHPPAPLLERIAALRERVPAWREAIPAGLDLARGWADLPTTRREDVATRVESLVPTDAPLDRLIVYETSGTTGHALRVPHHPGAVAQLHPLAERALGWHGARVATGPDAVACASVRAQASVWVYASVFAAWDEAGFARVNLHPAAWPSGPASARRFLGALAPGFLSGDPASFAELLRWDVELRPAALLSTALALSPALQAALSARYRCPVIDWYSTTETGPVACSRPGGPGLALLAPDLFVELLDGAGRPVPEGARGEITVTGGRNPYLPLLRYRTGDFARMALVPGPRGAPEPRLLDLEGRAAVLFRADDGSPVNPVDVGRALRHRFAVVQHEFVQRADRSCTARLRPAAGLPVDAEQVEAELRALFGPGTRLEVQIDPELGAAGKPIPYRCELEPPPAGA